MERSLIVDVWRSGDGAAIPLFRLSADIYFVYPDSGDEYLAASPYLDSDQLLDSSETTLTFRWAASREGNYRIEFRASILSSLDIEENLDSNSLEVEDVLAYSDLLLRDTREEGANPLFRNMTTDELEPWDHVTNDPFWTGDNKTGATGVQGWHVVAGGWNSPQSWYCGVPRDSRYANNADNSLVSQALNLEGYSNVGLSLLTRYYLEGRAYDNLRIYVSGDEENWTQLETYPGYGESNSAAEDGNHNSWLNKDYLLPDYVLNESFQIKLNFRSDNQINYAGVWLDDIQLYKLPDPDNYAPVAVIDSIGPQIVYQGEEVEFRGHGADDGSIKSYGWSSDIDGFLSDSDSFETSSLSPGNHSISFRVRDNEDLWSEKLWSSFLVRSPPSIQIEISHQRALENTAVAFLGTWLGEGEPDSLIWNSDIDGTLSTTKLAFCTDTLSPGEHIITLKGRDMNRVWSEEIQAIVLITQRPVALITGAPDNPVLDTETLELEGEAEGDVTIDAYAWRVLNKAGSEIYSGEAPPESLPVGDHTVYLKIMDDLWAWSEETQVTVLVHLRPTAIIHPLATVVVEGEDVLLAGKGEDDNGISRYVWTSSIDGQLQNSTKRNISTDSLSLGEHEISFLVLDGHGAWSHAAKTTLVVTEEPEAVIDRMVLGPILDDQHLILEGHGEDDGDIELLVWRSDLDGELYNGSETSVEVGPLSRGLHFLYLKVLDDSGVWSGEAETFVIVTKKPVAIIESVSPNPAKEGEAVEFQASTTDDADIHDHYVWSSDLDGELYNGSRTEFSTTGLSSGEHSISLIVQDNDGFWSEETTTSLTVEKKKSGGDDSPGFGLLFLVLVLALCATVVGKKRTR